MLLFVLLVIGLLHILTLMATNSDLKTTYSLSSAKYDRLLCYANEKNTTAMTNLMMHYAVNDKKAMVMFYQLKMSETHNLLSKYEYNIIEQYANDENETAKRKIKLHNMAIEERHEFYGYLDENISNIYAFISDCSLDKFCANSDIYYLYAENLNGTKSNVVP